MYKGPLPHSKGVRKLGRLWYPISATQRRLVRLGLAGTPALPDFLGIGVPKAGTTWLYANLAAHPQLFLPPKKEIHYFDLNWFQPLSWYSEIFDKAGDLPKGELTPTYCTLPSSRIRAIADLMPSIRLILILRDPVARDWSHIRMKLLRDTGRTSSEVSEHEFLAFARNYKRLDRGDYPTILERWMAYFTREQLHIGLYEDLVDEPRRFLEQVLAHVGAPLPHPWDLMPLNSEVKRGVEAQLPTSVRELLVAKHLPRVEELIALVGKDTVDRWRINWG